MAKPIFLIGVKGMFPQEMEKHTLKLSAAVSDYHVLFYSHQKDEMDFRVIYEKDFDEMKFEELKKIIEDSINK